MKKTYFFVILFFLLAMFLSGCGGGVVTPNGEVPPDTDQAVVQEVLPIHDLAEQKLNDIVEGPGTDAEGTLNILGEYLNEQTCVESTVVDGNLLQINYVSELISFILLQDLNDEPTLGGDTISENKLSIPDYFQTSLTNTIGIKSELDNHSTQNTKDIDDIVYTGGRNVLIWVPFAGEFNSWSGTTNDGEEWSHDIVSEYVNRFEDSALSFNIATLDNKEADVASLQNITDYNGMVVLNTHGSKGKWLATGEVVPWYLNSLGYYTWLLLNHMAIWQNMKVKGEGGVLASEPVYAVSSNWFNSNLSSNFSNTIILNISCQSAKTDALWNVFKGKGAGAYFGFTDTTSGGFGLSQGCDLIEKMREGDSATGDAYEEKTDPYYPNTTWIVWGKKNLKFPKDTVSSIVVFPETMNIGVGDSQSIDSITAHYDNGFTSDIALNACIYDSSNIGIATVNTGVITAVAPGSSTITVGYTESDITEADTVAVTVSSDANHAPVISSLTADPSSVDINESTTITCTASDQDGDTLTYTWTKTGGTFEGSTSGPSVTWRAPSTEGNYTVGCEVSDGEATDSEQVIISVGEVNHPPVITSSAVTSATKDEPYSYDVNANDFDGDTLVYSLTTKPSGMSINSSTGLIAWTPTTSGDYNVTVKVSDGELSATQSFTITVGVGGDYVIEFEDYNFEQVIRETINKPEGPLYLSDVIGIKTLNAIERGIKSMKGIQHLQNLQILWFDSNQVSDISALQNLTNLYELSFDYNQVSDISALQNLTNLQELSFDSNQVSDISALQNLTNLLALYFHGNQVSDISALQNLTNLLYLSFHHNQVSDISALQNLTNLLALYFQSNQVSDISALQNLTNLSGLVFHHNQVSDISFLQNLTNLSDLWFGSNQVSDISFLQNLTNLWRLSFVYNQVSDISALVKNEGFSSGDYISMGYNYLDLAEGSQNMQDIENLISRCVDVDYIPQRNP